MHNIIEVERVCRSEARVSIRRILYFTRIRIPLICSCLNGFALISSVNTSRIVSGSKLRAAPLAAQTKYGTRSAYMTILSFAYRVKNNDGVHDAVLGCSFCVEVGESRYETLFGPNFTGTVPMSRRPLCEINGDELVPGLYRYHATNSLPYRCDANLDPS